MKRHHSTVYIFGAGATRGGYEKALIPPPIDIEFFNMVNMIKGRGTKRLAREVLETVWELNNRVEGVGLEEYYRDIETRAIIVGFAKPKNQPKNWSKRQQQITELIRRVYIHTTCDDRKEGMLPKPSEIHKKILERLKADDAIITFNYDTVIEESMMLGLWNPLDGYGIKAFGKEWCQKWFIDRSGDASAHVKSKILLLKLHGSINWSSYQNKKLRLKTRPYCIKTNRGKPVTENVLLLAPGYNKKIYKNPYVKLWREARHKLENCESLVILGYSLPETDLLARALFSEVIRQRSTTEEYIKDLHLVDPSGLVKDKFIKLFTPAIGPNGRIFKYRDLEEYSKRVS